MATTTKRIIGNFFYFEEDKNGLRKIDELFAYQKNIINSGKVQNIKVSNFYLRITFLEKRYDPKNSNKYWWLGIIERLETSEAAETSNLEGVKKTYATGEDEGPIRNTGFLFDPLTKTVLLHRKIGGVNSDFFGIFIRKLLKETNVVKKGIRNFKLHVLPDLYKLDRLSRAPQIHALEYSFRLPKSLEVKQSKNRPIVGDLLLIGQVGGEFMKVSIRSKKMNVKETIQKVFKVKELGEDNVKSLKVITEHDSIEEPLDLLTSKFTTFKDSKLENGKKETVVLIMDVLFELFLKQRTLIENMYVNRKE